jgi:hypothetical protein
MEPIYSRVADVVAELTGGESGVFIPIDEIADAMQQEWPELFPRHRRIVARWCYHVVERGLLIAETPDDGLRLRCGWGELRYAVA